MGKSFEIVATRRYYSNISFVIDAESADEAYDKAQRMIDDCVVEFDGIDGYEDADEIDVFEKVVS